MKFYMWSSLHYFMMIGPFIITLVLYLITKNKSETVKRNIGLIFSIIAILLLIVRNIEIFILSGYVFDFELVPLQICHFANFVMLYAYYKRSDVVFGFAFLFNMPLAFLSLLFADGLENYATILSIRGQAYIWGHMLIVSTTLYAYVAGLIKMDKSKFIKAAYTVSILTFSSVIVNNLFRVLLDQRSNYFYTEHPELGTPLETFFNWGQVVHIGSFEVNIVYTALMVLSGPLLMYLFYALAFELPRYQERKKNQELI